MHLAGPARRQRRRRSRRTRGSRGGHGRRRSPPVPSVGCRRPSPPPRPRRRGWPARRRGRPAMLRGLVAGGNQDGDQRAAGGAAGAGAAAAGHGRQGAPAAPTSQAEPASRQETSSVHSQCPRIHAFSPSPACGSWRGSKARRAARPGSGASRCVDAAHAVAAAQHRLEARRVAGDGVQRPAGPWWPPAPRPGRRRAPRGRAPPARRPRSAGRRRPASRPSARSRRDTRAPAAGSARRGASSARRDRPGAIGTGRSRTSQKRPGAFIQSMRPGSASTASAVRRKADGAARPSRLSTPKTPMRRMKP